MSRGRRCVPPCPQAMGTDARFGKAELDACRGETHVAGKRDFHSAAHGIDRRSSLSSVNILLKAAAYSCRIYPCPLAAPLTKATVTPLALVALTIGRDEGPLTVRLAVSPLTLVVATIMKGEAPAAVHLAVSHLNHTMLDIPSAILAKPPKQYTVPTCFSVSASRRTR